MFAIFYNHQIIVSNKRVQRDRNGVLIDTIVISCYTIRQLLNMGRETFYNALGLCQWATMPFNIANSHHLR